MLCNPMTTPWEKFPFSFQIPFRMIWFWSPDGYVDGYMLDFGSFEPVDVQAFWLRIPFTSHFCDFT